jgi:hypothetical protein
MEKKEGDAIKSSGTVYHSGIEWQTHRCKGWGIFLIPVGFVEQEGISYRYHEISCPTPMFKRSSSKTEFRNIAC